jgi:hypothetical protein
MARTPGSRGLQVAAGQRGWAGLVDLMNHVHAPLGASTLVVLVPRHVRGRYARDSEAGSPLRANLKTGFPGLVSVSEIASTK